MPASAPIASDYQRLLTERRAALARAERAHVRFSYLRLAIAAAALVMLVGGGWASAVWLLVPAGVFVGVAVWHARLLNERERIRSAVEFYERALARLAGRWAGRGRTGERFRPAEHLYAQDLDLFGRASLFDLLSTVRTDGGEETLARWLLAPSSADVARARQEAIRELIPRLDLRESVAVIGDVVRKGVDARMLRSWATSPIVLGGTGPRVLLASLVVLSGAAIAYWVRTGVTGVLAVLVLQGLGAQWFRTRVHAVADAVDEPSHELDVLAGLLNILEGERFQSPLLERLRGEVGGRTRLASSEIAQLSQSVALLSSRENLLFAIPASLVLWTTQCAFAIEAWRARCGGHLTHWLDAVGEFEALLAFATFAAEHPGYVFPEFVDGPALLAATGVAHPVLPPDAVANDVALGDGPVRLLIVSGSNMSGKSTLLRTIGVNVVLAHAGAPVRASSFRLSPLSVGASISIHDSLVDGRSRFFAEIQRLKGIVDLTKAERGHVLFLFDEILGGTNSHDRRVGAAALLAGLVRDGAIGLATTHDLAIGEVVDRLAPAAANVHFEDRFEQGRLTFDYRMRPGIVRTSNAIALMRSVGLEVNET